MPNGDLYDMIIIAVEADAHRHIEVEAGAVFFRHEQRRFAKAVTHGGFQVGVAPQGDPPLRPAVYSR